MSDTGRQSIPRHEDEAWFRYLADSAPVMIGTTDKQGNITYVSRSWLEFTGTSSAENLGDCWLTLVHPEDVVRTREEIEGAISAREPYAVEYRLKRQDGVYRWILDKAVLRYAPSGEYIGYIGTAVDITELVEAREDKLRLEARAKDAQRLESLGILAGGVAHDFNNLLTGILGHLSLAELELPADSPALRRIKRIEKAALQASELTRQLLAFSGRSKFVVQPLNLSEIIQGMQELLKLSVSKKASLSFELVRDLPAVEADMAQVRQVIMNLVINASEALMEKPGSIVVSCGSRFCPADYLKGSIVEREVKPGDYVYIQVADSGCGMSAETAQKIFTPFFSTKLSGRGLGLAAVEGIVQAYVGFIRIESELDQGTSFAVFFPACAKPAMPLKELLADSLTGAVQAAKGSGLVLLVDDEEAVRVVAGEMLSRLGFSVLEARDGREALRLFSQKKSEIRFVLLDLTMPVMSGEETLCAIRELSPEIKVILSSGYNPDRSIDRLLMSGLTLFLQKPYCFENLEMLVKQIVDD